MPTLSDAVNDSGNFNHSVELGTQNLNTTGTITAGKIVAGRPYGSFSSSQTQAIASTAAAQAITFNTDEYKSLITHSTVTNNSRITVDEAGNYEITFSVIAKCSSSGKLFNVWLAVNGVNIARTNTIQNLSTGSVERIITVAFCYTFTAGQYFEIMMWSDSTNTTIEATGVQASPTRPACPSIILDISRNSS
jgi:high-affinity K+ transport system ATPase subunit B